MKFALFYDDGIQKRKKIEKAKRETSCFCRINMEYVINI